MEHTRSQGKSHSQGFDSRIGVGEAPVPIPLRKHLGDFDIQPDIELVP